MKLMFIVLFAAAAVQGQSPVFETNAQTIRVVTIAEGLSNPWSLAFLPNGDMLVTERTGGLRLIRHGVLQPEPIAGTPAVRYRNHGGMMDIALHPRFAENNLLYLTYSKPREKETTTALMRARFDGTRLVDAKDIFIADAWTTSDVARAGRPALRRGGRPRRQAAEDGSRHARRAGRVGELTNGRSYELTI